MTSKLRISRLAEDEIRNLYAYLDEFSPDIADHHLVRLRNAVSAIESNPTRYAYFFLTGAPYRARLFLIGSTSFWIVYKENDADGLVDILRIWDSRQNPDDFDIA
jgi:plasmid stabilization system protein ParE